MAVRLERLIELYRNVVEGSGSYKGETVDSVLEEECDSEDERRYWRDQVVDHFRAEAKEAAPLEKRRCDVCGQIFGSPSAAGAHKARVHS